MKKNPLEKFIDAENLIDSNRLKTLNSKELINLIKNRALSPVPSRDGKYAEFFNDVSQSIGIQFDSCHVEDVLNLFPKKKNKIDELISILSEAKSHFINLKSTLGPMHLDFFIEEDEIYLFIMADAYQIPMDDEFQEMIKSIAKIVQKNASILFTSQMILENEKNALWLKMSLKTSSR